MTRFEYLSVLMSIIIGLGLSEMIGRWSHLLRHRTTVKFYWIHALWTGLFVLMIVQWWWAFWQFHNIEHWAFFGLMARIVEVIVLVMAALALTPPRDEARSMNLRTYYYEQSRVFFSLSAALLVSLTLTDWVVAGYSLLHPENAVRAPAILLLAALAYWRNPRLHAAAVMGAYAMFGTFLLVASIPS